MRRRRVPVVIRTLGHDMSRRAVVRDAMSVLAGLLLGHLVAPTQAEGAQLTQGHRDHETPHEACYRLCVTDPVYPLTPERLRQCGLGCAVWTGADAPF
jgi:hypothetical protein